MTASLLFGASLGILVQKVADSCMVVPCLKRNTPLSLCVRHWHWRQATLVPRWDCSHVYNHRTGRVSLALPSLGRPTYLSADLCFTTDSSFLLSCFLFSPPVSELAERNSTKIGHMLGRNCDLKTHVQNLGYLLPLQIGDPEATFLRRLRN